MRLALAVVAFLIAYGSLYPFDVNMGAPVDWRAFATTLGTDLSRADLLANVILFVPLGFFAAAGWRAGSGGAYAWSWTKALVVVALSLVFAAALQVLQLYLPSRDPNLQDACWNLLGTLLGMALARLLMARTFAMTPGVGRGSTEHYWVTAGLAVSWAAYRLSPFVPSFDVQSLKDGLKPLTAVLLSGRPADAITSGYAGGFELYRDVVLWSAFTWLAAHSFVRPPRDVHLLWLVPALLAAELMVVDNVLFPSDVLGAVLALVLWFAWFRRSAGDVSILVLALLSVIVVDGLSPLELRGEIGPFNWVPFHGFLTGSMLLNVNALLLKVFMYGAALWLLRESSGQIVAATMFLVLVVSFVEGAQIFLVGHTAEITDPLFVLGLGIAVALLAPRSRRNRDPSRAAVAGHA